jgi:hypothetical protein
VKWWFVGIRFSFLRVYHIRYSIAKKIVPSHGAARHLSQNGKKSDFTLNKNVAYALKINGFQSKKFLPPMLFSLTKIFPVFV